VRCDCERSKCTAAVQCRRCASFHCCEGLGTSWLVAGNRIRTAQLGGVLEKIANARQGKPMSSNLWKLLHKKEKAQHFLGVGRFLARPPLAMTHLKKQTGLRALCLEVIQSFRSASSRAGFHFTSRVERFLPLQGQPDKRVEKLFRARQELPLVSALSSTTVGKRVLQLLLSASIRRDTISHSS
jgi:hypothetical protein